MQGHAAAPSPKPDLHIIDTEASQYSFVVSDDEPYQQVQQAQPAQQAQPNPVPAPPSKTIYIGGINGPGAKKHHISKAALTVTDVCSHIKAMAIITQPLVSVRILAEKSCAFIDFACKEDALAFFRACHGGSEDHQEFYHLRRIVNISGIELRVGWSKPSAEPPNLALAISKGATRCVFLHPVEAGSESALADFFAKFGTVDCVKVVPEKNIAFIHLGSIREAIEAVSQLGATKQWKRVSFGSDRVVTKPRAPKTTASGEPTDTELPLSTSRDAKKQKQMPGLCEPPASTDDKGKDAQQNRTIYIGSLPLECTLVDVCNVIRAEGPILSIRITAGAAFVTFVEHGTAQSFYDTSVQNGLIINSKRASIGWGKSLAQKSAQGTPNHGQLSASVISMIRLGATRCLHIGSLDSINVHELGWASKDSSAAEKLYGTNSMYQERLQQFFSEHGTIESLDVVHLGCSTGTDSRRVAFINFSSIMEAHRAMEAARKDARFSNAKLGYGKDRCTTSIHVPATKT